VWTYSSISTFRSNTLPPSSGLNIKILRKETVCASVGKAGPSVKPNMSSLENKWNPTKSSAIGADRSEVHIYRFIVCFSRFITNAY
jgi:hypothetical protein